MSEFKTCTLGDGNKVKLGGLVGFEDRTATVTMITREVKGIFVWTDTKLQGETLYTGLFFTPATLLHLVETGAAAPALPPMAGGQEEEGAGSEPEAQMITDRWARALATAIANGTLAPTPSTYPNLANYFAIKVLKGSVTGYGAATVTWAKGARTGTWTWRQVAEQILVFTEEGAAQPPKITRARPLEYRGYLIHNETPGGTYSIYKGKTDGNSLQGYGYRTLDKAMAQVDKYAAEGPKDPGAAPVIDRAELARVQAESEETRALIQGSMEEGGADQPAAPVVYTMEQVMAAVLKSTELVNAWLKSEGSDVWVDATRVAWNTSQLLKGAGLEEAPPAAQPTDEELTRAGAMVIAMAMKRGGQAAATEAGRQGLARYFFKLHGMELISVNRNVVMGHDSNGQAKGAMWPEVIALVLAQDDEQKA